MQGDSGSEGRWDDGDGLMWQRARYGGGWIARSHEFEDDDQLNYFTDDDVFSEGAPDPRAYSQMFEEDFSSDEDEPVTFVYEEIELSDTEVPDSIDVVEHVWDSNEATQVMDLTEDMFQYPLNAIHERD